MGDTTDLSAFWVPNSFCFNKRQYWT